MTRTAEFAVRIVISFATIAWALDPAILRVARNASTSGLAAGRAGLVVEVDPPAGQGASTAGPIAGDAALTRSTEGLVVERLPDGSRRVDLRGRFRSYSVASLAADGTIKLACADDEAGAIALAQAAALRPAADPAPRSARVTFGPRED